MLIEVRKVRILFKSHPLYLHCRKEEREATMIGKTKRHSVLFLVLVLIVLSGCGKTAAADLSPQAKKIIGKWAYIHAKEETVAEFKEDGTATYQGEKYTFDCDDTFVHLTGKEGQVTKLRYEVAADGIYLYQHTDYSYTGEGTPESIYGSWRCEEKKWSFEFTKEGTFLEDGYFPGKYVLDEANSTVKLIYGDKFEDTVFYYAVRDNILSIEYPWKMVPTGSE